MWFSALIIVVGVACVMALLRLRSVLMTTFPPLIVRRLPEGFPPPAATADLYEKAAAELMALGFSSPQWVVVAPEKETPGAFAIIAAAFCHAGKNTLALLQPPLNIAAPNELTVHFVTRLADGRKLTSNVRSSFSEMVADDKHPAQTITGETLVEQWAQHQHWVAGFNTPAAAGFGSLETLSEELQEIRGVDVRLVSAGKLWRDAQGVARPTLAFALRILRLYWTRPRPKANKINVPLARQLMFATFNEHWQKRLLPVRWQWLLLVTAGILFVVLGAVFLELALTLAVLGAFILHEGSHYLATRAFGCRHRQIPMVPLIGCAVAGIEQTPSATQRAWIAMMGLLSGIVLGWILLGFVDFDEVGTGVLSTTILTAAIPLLLLNYFSLLPMPPLDGSLIAQAILSSRLLVVRAVFIVIICIASIAAAIYFDIYLLIALVLMLFLWIPSLFANDRLVRLLAANPFSPGASPDQQRRLVLEALQQRVGEATNLLRRLQQAQAIVGALTQTAVNWKHRAALATVYLGLLCLPLIFWGMVAMETPSEPSLPLQINSEKQKQTQQRVFLSLEGLNVPQLLSRMPEPEPPKPSGGWLMRLRKPVPPPLPTPADSEQITAAQNRLGVNFPGDYREFLSLHDGYPSLQLLPLAQVRRLPETDYFSDENNRQESRTYYFFAFPPSSFEGADIEAVPGQRVWRGEELRNCAVIGGLTDVFAAQGKKEAMLAEILPTLLWCPQPAFEQARIVSLGESLWAPDFTTYLRYKVTQKIAERELAESNEAP